MYLERSVENRLRTWSGGMRSGAGGFLQSTTSRMRTQGRFSSDLPGADFERFAAQHVNSLVIYGSASVANLEIVRAGIEPDGFPLVNFAGIGAVDKNAAGLEGQLDLAAARLIGEPGEVAGVIEGREAVEQRIVEKRRVVGVPANVARADGKSADTDVRLRGGGARGGKRQHSGEQATGTGGHGREPPRYTTYHGRWWFQV